MRFFGATMFVIMILGAGLNLMMIVLHEKGLTVGANLLLNWVGFTAAGLVAAAILAGLTSHHKDANTQDTASP